VKHDIHYTKKLEEAVVATNYLVTPKTAFRCHKLFFYIHKIAFSCICFFDMYTKRRFLVHVIPTCKQSLHVQLKISVDDIHFVDIQKIPILQWFISNYGKLSFCSKALFNSTGGNLSPLQLVTNYDQLNWSQSVTGCHELNWFSTCWTSPARTELVGNSD